ncbi:hypothetical protein DESC_910024 [Desulfosarcina cetonica]|nr:hypothetical protein [Desulfosarcina cetonica]VTR71224.1 hypothetical protein DESC_910024 [Desulfosarcina cetonica]
MINQLANALIDRGLNKAELNKKNNADGTAGEDRSSIEQANPR